MLRAVRRTPVIVVTARDDDPSIVKALDAGADDYVVKPFGMDQLEARIRAVLRRTETEEPDEPLRVGDLVVDAVTPQLHARRARRGAVASEFDLLLLLAQRAGEVVTKREILEEVWNQPYGGGERTVDVHLSWLRRKLGETAAHPVYLHSVRGVGVASRPPAAPRRRRDGPPTARPDGRRIAWLVAATTSAVVVAFIVPLCFLVAEHRRRQGHRGPGSRRRASATLVATLDDTGPSRAPSPT